MSVELRTMTQYFCPGCRAVLLAVPIEEPHHCPACGKEMRWRQRDDQPDPRRQHAADPRGRHGADTRERRPG